MESRTEAHFFPAHRPLYGLVRFQSVRCFFRWLSGEQMTLCILAPCHFPVGPLFWVWIWLTEAPALSVLLSFLCFRSVFHLSIRGQSHMGMLHSVFPPDLHAPHTFRCSQTVCPFSNTSPQSKQVRLKQSKQIPTVGSSSGVSLP